MPPNKRCSPGSPIATTHRSITRTRKSHYVSIRYSERLAVVGIEPSVGGSVDRIDKALAQTISELFKAELIHPGAPWNIRN